MAIEARVPLFDLVTRIAETVDLASPLLANHHIQVAYIAFSLAKAMELSEEEKNTLFMAGALHDIGAFSVEERSDELDIDIEDCHRHARSGYYLLKDFEPFAKIANLIRFHHVLWDDGLGAAFEGQKVLLGSHIIHLADRISVLIDPKEAIIWQAQRIREIIAEKTPHMFVPELVEAFQDLSLKDYFWFDVASRSTSTLIRSQITLETLELDMEALLTFANVFRRMIDFRSIFTATHSSGVAACATTLARLAGFDDRDCNLMQIASYFHDVGKLAISQEIVEKKEPLTEYEYDLMRSHVYHTYRILESMLDIETVRTWGALHQEYLDGTGYPFRYTEQELPQGSRILVVSDVFTALVEDRPYRKGMELNAALEMLQRLADEAKLDAGIVKLLRDNFDKIVELCGNVQNAAEQEYRHFISLIE